MSDRAAPRRAAREFRLEELAAHVGGRVEGDERIVIKAIRTLEHAGPGELSFVSRPSFLEQARASRAAALMVPPDVDDLLDDLSRTRLVVENPSFALAQLLALVYPQTAAGEPGVHETAIVGEDCEIAASASIGPYAVIGASSRIGAGSRIGAHAVVGRHCSLGEGVVLHPHAVLYDHVDLGDRVELHAGAVLGSDGFGYVFHQGEHVKIPQVGRAVVEDDVEIGALSAVDRAVLEETRIGAGSKIDNLVQVGHNVLMGRHCMLCGQAGLAGSAVLRDYVVLGGQAGSVGHIEIGEGVQAAARSVVTKSVPAGRKVAGDPAVEIRKAHRQKVLVGRLDEMRRRLAVLERRLEAQDSEARKRGEEE